MEVHHHSHTSRKKWTHYFWEFLMLFLAVFCGFLAEYKLEHTIEHQREKEFMITMLEDLRDDTAYLHQMTKEWDNVNRSLDSVIAALEGGSTKENMVKAYRHLNNAFNFWGFSNHDRTISQLKFSGGFRIIRNKIVANKIISYDQFNINALKKIGEQYNFFYETAVTLRNKVFAQGITYTIFRKYRYDQPPPSDDKWIEGMIFSNLVPVTQEIYSAQLFEFKSALYSYRKDFSNMAFGYRKTEEMATELIDLIKENYHLK